MVGAILVLATLPYLHFHFISSGKFRYFYRYSLFIFFFSFIILLWIGQEMPSTPFIEIGRIFTIVYFSYFFVMVPLISFLEHFMFHFRVYSLLNPKEFENLEAYSDWYYLLRFNYWSLK
jgi:quinol-cytochrome oxidoreductase complex cytochrome b subunit